MKVKPHMFPTLEQRIAAELAGDSTVCPFCGLDLVIPGTLGYLHGVCPTCYEKAKAAALRGYAADRLAKLDYDAARQQKSRADRKAGGVPVYGKNVPPDFDALRRS